MKDFAEMSEEIAFEESSHAVIRDYFGANIIELSIGDDGESYCDFRARIGDKDMMLLQNIAGCLAGKVAADRVRGYKQSEEEWHATNDYHRALDCALRLNAADKAGADLLMSWLARRTELLVDRLWPQIHKLAFALLEREKLDGEQIAKVLAV